MQKGTMITGIIDTNAFIGEVYASITKSAKEGGLFHEKETAYIASFFSVMLKEGHQYIERTKELLTPKQNLSEQDRQDQLLRMYTIMRGYRTCLQKIEKGFEKLCEERNRQRNELAELKKIFQLPLQRENLK